MTLKGVKVRKILNDILKIKTLYPINRAIYVHNSNRYTSYIDI